MKRHYFKYNFAFDNLDLVYETDGEDEKKTLTRVCRILQERRKADNGMDKMVSSALDG